jgi:LuxR family maltose regulon positive regulatory protein
MFKKTYIVFIGLLVLAVYVSVSLGWLVALTYLGWEIRGRIREFRSLAQGKNVANDRDNTLNPREKQMLVRIADGMSDDEIAADLFLSESRVKQYMSSLYVKVGSTCREESIELARKKGLLKTIMH